MTPRSLRTSLAGLALMLSTPGCLSVTPLLGIKEVQRTISVAVTSSPMDAEVYLNGMMVGKTPCTIPLSFAVDTMTWEPKGIHAIRVVKAGYRDEARPVQFERHGEFETSVWWSNVNYHFALRKLDESTGEPIAPEAVSGVTLPPFPAGVMQVAELTLQGSIAAVDWSAAQITVVDAHGFHTPIIVTRETAVQRENQPLPISQLQAGMRVEVKYLFDANTAKRYALGVQMLSD